MSLADLLLQFNSLITSNINRLLQSISNTSAWKRKRKFLFITGFSLLVFVLLSFLLRNIFFNYYLHQYISRFNQAFHAELTIEKARIPGISSLEMEGISLRPEKGDTLLRIDSAYASISFWKLLAGRITLTNFELKNTRVTFIRKDSLTNYMFLLERKTGKKMEADTLNPSNYASRATSILNAVFDKIPDDLVIRNFTIATLYNGHELLFHIDTFNIVDHHFRSPIHITENKEDEHWMAEGNLDKHEHIARFTLYSADHQKIRIPFIQFRWNAEITFDTIRFSVEEKSNSEKLLCLGGDAALQGLEIDHSRIAAEKISFGTGAVDYVINIGNDFIELDSLSTVVFNRLSLNPYLKYRPKPTKQITLQIDKHDFPAQDLFSSLPPGLFQNLDGMKTTGKLDFHLLFDADLSIPDSLKFECELKRKNFIITAFGQTNFGYINEPFEYTAYEKGQPARIFMVGPENPNFRSLEQISPYLRNAILNSEDGAFFSHRGFLPESFRESIVTNIKERRFARGGSTITMQLVKNVFLNRNKTIARKLEEVIIVWLIENMQLSTKERMYEVYLNVIEWGPDIYGAQEAAKFYFNKDVAKITYAEAIFLASIVPRPKYFMYSFDKETGMLRDYIRNYFQRMADKMLKKEMITPEDYARLKPEIELKGPARLLLRQAETSYPADSLLMLEMQLLK